MISENSTFVLMDFSRSCLFIDLTIFGTSCFNNHLGLDQLPKFSISSFIDNISINASKESMHHKQQSNSNEEKTQPLNKPGLKHKNLKYLTIFPPTE